MNQGEHVSTARALMTRADQEKQHGGNDMIAAELLWGAFAHCLITVALNEGLPHDSHGASRRIAQRLDNIQGGNTWASSFGTPERLHFHFYHGNLPAEELNSHTREAETGAINLLQTL